MHSAVSTLDDLSDGMIMNGWVVLGCRVETNSVRDGKKQKSEGM